MQPNLSATGVAIGQLELSSQFPFLPVVPTTTRRARHDSNVSAAECIVCFVVLLTIGSPNDSPA
jgi:hypothetical protein